MSRPILEPYTVLIRGYYAQELIVWLPKGATHSEIIEEAWDKSLDFELPGIDLDPNDIEVIDHG